MKTNLTGNFLPFTLMWSMCLVLFVTASGCTSTSIPITPSEPIDAPDTFAFVPVKEGERDLYVAVSTGDNVLVYTKDNRKLDIVLTEADSKKQTITGRGTVLYKQNYSWRSLPVYEPSVDVSFSEIENIEIKEPEGGWPAPPNRWAQDGKALLIILCGPLCW